MTTEMGQLGKSDSEPGTHHTFCEMRWLVDARGYIDFQCMRLIDRSDRWPQKVAPWSGRIGKGKMVAETKVESAGGPVAWNRIGRRAPHTNLRYMGWQKQGRRLYGAGIFREGNAVPKDGFAENSLWTASSDHRQKKKMRRDLAVIPVQSPAGDP